jgi:Methyltransferase domain
MPLINRELIVRALTHEAPWCGSHGADGDYLGMGLGYYWITYLLRARLAVCLGSGGGFVPRLMRQAQRDLGIEGQARTILVDANRPEAGWGAPAWLAPDSFFRREYGDVEIVLQTTEAAAQTLFAPQGLTIDYLHIDADHSLAACLADFRAYRPFLRSGSVVTLHDTSLGCAGVTRVVEYLRTRGDCEVVDFADVGCGTAIVQIVPVPPPPPRPATGGTAVQVRRRANAPVFAPAAVGWAYLESPAFGVRGVIAASFLRDCSTVVELGGGKATIDQFLTGSHASVIVVDPLLPDRTLDTLNGSPCAVEHVRARFQDLDWVVTGAGSYGIVMLGLELQGLVDDDCIMLWQLIGGARVTVAEFATSWHVSREQFAAIRQRTHTREIFTCKLDLQGNELGDLSHSWPPRCDREIHVLVPR